MPPYSKVIQTLDPILQQQLQDEFLLCQHSSLWGPHSLPLIKSANTPEYLSANIQVFGQGLTFWLRNITRDWHLTADNTKLWPITMQTIMSIVGTRKLGRIFYHMLRPGDSILRHNDQKVPFRYQIANRYHLYLDIHQDVSILLDEKIIDNSQMSNSVLDFNWLLDHEYINNSNKPFAFFVFDVVTDDVVIKNSQ